MEGAVGRAVLVVGFTVVEMEVVGSAVVVSDVNVIVGDGVVDGGGEGV